MRILPSAIVHKGRVFLGVSWCFFSIISAEGRNGWQGRRGSDHRKSDRRQDTGLWGNRIMGGCATVAIERAEFAQQQHLLHQSFQALIVVEILGIHVRRGGAFLFRSAEIVILSE